MEVAVSVRGIYATALTQRLHQSHSVVVPSSTIRNRFDASFSDAEPEVRIESSRDRVGVELTGREGAVEVVGETLGGVARDGFRWQDPVPQNAVVDGVVVGSRGGGAIIDLGEREGYLPYDATEDDIEDGDVVRVQVRDVYAPWVDRRHVVRPGIVVSGLLVSLVRGVDADVAGTPSAAPDLARTTDLLDVAVPSSWGVQWEAGAIDCEFRVLESALETMVTRAQAVESALDTEDPNAEPGPTVRATPVTTEWVRFGREGRFELDDDRRAVISTIPGHHRIKAGGETAGTAVDFAERLDAAVDSFPWGVVTEQFGPATGDSVHIRHGKPDGRQYDLGPGDVTGIDPASTLVEVHRTMHRDGTYDGLDVEKVAGDVAVSKFREGRWWYPTTYRSDDGVVRGTYVNVNTPIEIFPDAVTYVDLHVDVVKWPDGSVAVVDDDELVDAVDAGHVTAGLAEQARAVASSVATALRGEEEGA